MKYFIIIILGFYMTGCSTGNCRSLKEAKAAENPNTNLDELSKMKETTKGSRVRVYKFDGTLQCNEGKKIPIETMEKELSSLKVYMRMNKNDGQMRMQKCGAVTGNANIYEIDRENLEAALKLGFKEWSAE